MISKKKGKFIILYGINNLGKTTQARKLVERLNHENILAEYIKYPIYDSEPSGKLINEYLRSDNPYKFTPREFQLLHYIDRINFETILKEKLSKGINIIAEDYFGTAMAWGMATGVNEELLKYLNNFLYKEDLCFLFDGEKFIESKEKGHKHEENMELTKKAREAHLKLAPEYNWVKINANREIDEIHEILWKKVIETVKIDN